MCTWLGFRPIYDTFLHNPKGYHTSMIPTLFIHSKYADHLIVIWYIKRLKKYSLQKYPEGGGGWFDFQPMVYHKIGITYCQFTDYYRCYYERSIESNVSTRKIKKDQTLASIQIK